MEYYKVDPHKPDVKSIQAAVEVLKKCGIIVYPTDTLYGLGVDILQDKAINKLFLVKKRRNDAPVSFIVDSIDSIEKLIGEIEPEIKKILEQILPGKYTVLLENKDPDSAINLKLLNGHTKKDKRLGIRIPDHPICHELAIQMDGPIASTSANLSGEKNALTITEILAQFGNKIDLILDAGKMKSSAGSTVIDFTKRPYLIMREGDISIKELQEKLPDITFNKRRTVFSVNFVCSGNICRSPMAEGIFKKMIEKTRFKDIIEVRSAGTLDLSNVHAHDFSIKVGDDNGVDLSHHRARHINKRIIEDSDLIFCLAMNHLTYLKSHYPNYKNKFFLLKEWKREKRLSNPSIADPIGHDLKFFNETHNEITTELKRIFPEVMSLMKDFIEYNDL
jgi:L-threonylcarbamoyladenylate synthase